MDLPGNQGKKIIYRGLTLFPCPQVLIRTFDINTQFKCGMQREIRIAKKLTGQEYEIRLSFFKNGFCLDRGSNKAQWSGQDAGFFRKLCSNLIEQ
jgi:hypothetical protein